MAQILTIILSKFYMARHAIASVRNESKLKVIVLTVSVIALWLGAFVLFREGFGWIIGFGRELGGNARGIGSIIMARLLGVLSLVIFFMLIFSNMLVAFSTLYRSQEVAFLLLAPMRFRALFVARFFECLVFSSWALAYLGSPLILAYGLSIHAPISFYLISAAFFLPFVTLPAAFGAVFTMILSRIFPQLKMRTILLFALLVVTVLFVYWNRSLSAQRLSEDTLLPALLDMTAQTQSPFLPSYWMSRGVLAAADYSYGDSFFYFMLILANAAMALLIAAYTADHLFYQGWSALCGQDKTRVKPFGRGILGRLDQLFWFVPNPFRALAVKDIKLFWRDPSQWSQFVIFFGIMGIYIANLRNTSAHYQQEFWKSWIACLNTGACTLILATLTSRFVFPLVSLEGRRFWILGLAPLSFNSIVWQKFWLSVAITSLFTVGLSVLSGLMLQLEPIYFALSIYSVIITNFSLTGLAVGLGSLYPDFQEDNPARIVSGMGGTLNFLISVVYLVLVVGAQTFILQWRVLNLFSSNAAFYWALTCVVFFITTLSLISIIVPMRLGLRNLQCMEF